MYCRNCGAELDEGAHFCANCGLETVQDINPFPVETAKKGFKKPIWLGVLCGFLGSCLVIGALFFIGASHLGSTQYEGNGYSSPEDAVIAYLTALKNCDEEEMLSTFAIESLVDHLDYTAYLESNHGIYTTALPKLILPADTSFSRELMVTRAASSLTYYIVKPYFLVSQSAVGDEGFDFGKTFDDEDDDEIEEFFEELSDPSNQETLKKLKIGDFVDYEDIFGEPGDYIEYNYEQYKEIYGVEDTQTLFVEVELDGKNCYFGMIVFCYDGAWYNYAPASQYLGYRDFILQ